MYTPKSQVVIMLRLQRFFLCICRDRVCTIFWFGSNIMCSLSTLRFCDPYKLQNTFFGHGRRFRLCVYVLWVSSKHRHNVFLHSNCNDFLRANTISWKTRKKSVYLFISELNRYIYYVIQLIEENILWQKCPPTGFTNWYRLSV